LKTGDLHDQKRRKQAVNVQGGIRSLKKNEASVTDFPALGLSIKAFEKSFVEIIETSEVFQSASIGLTVEKNESKRPARKRKYHTQKCKCKSCGSQNHAYENRR
jgi:hypothetical protein